MPFSDISLSLTSMTHRSSSHSSSRVDTPHTVPSAGNEEHLVSALHAAFHDQHHDSREKPHASLDIAVTNDQLVLRGMGDDVEPAVLAGNVVLHLTEPTAIKQILLVFKGKARVASGITDPHALSSSSQQYVVCSHEWAFLEGEKKHSHMLKAGRHLFPFELYLGGSLPSSLVTYANGSAFISYKLRATAIRPGLAANLHAMRPIIVLRTFAPGSLEYQQTLEIESTWPEKVMYSLMIPYKAWAAGDEMTVVVKFSPLVKGVRVASITTFISEMTKMMNRSGHFEKTRNVVTRKHEIVHGHAVPCDDLGRGYVPKEQGQAGISNASPYCSSDPSTSCDAHGSAPPAAHTDTDADIELHAEDESEISTTIHVPLPAGLTPSHTLDPILVSHRIRWSVLLANLDGHTSELRCSLPIHVLDHVLLDEARSATSPTRRLLLNDGHASNDASQEEAQLPSYPSHVRDRGVHFDSSAALLSSSVTSPTGEMTDACVHRSAYARDSGPISEPASERDSPVDSPGPSRPASRSGRDSSCAGRFGLVGRSSRAASRANSRAASPEHAESAIAPNAAARADVVTFVHHTNAASRQSHGLFSATLKPMSGFSAAWSSHTQAHVHHLQRSTNAASAPVEAPLGGNALARAHASASTSAVPDYFTAAHSGASAVPPLDLLSTLPTYEDSERDAHAQAQSNDAEGVVAFSSASTAPETTDSTTGSVENVAIQRSLSDTDLVSHFSRSRGGARRFQLQMQAMQ